MSLDELLERFGGVQAGKPVAVWYTAELQRRAALADITAAQASERAAVAAEKAAYWTKVSAIAVSVTVIVTAIGILATMNS